MAPDYNFLARTLWNLLPKPVAKATTIPVLSQALQAQFEAGLSVDARLPLGVMDLIGALEQWRKNVSDPYQKVDFYRLFNTTPTGGGIPGLPPPPPPSKALVYMESFRVDPSDPVYLIDGVQPMCYSDFTESVDAASYAARIRFNFETYVRPVLDIKKALGHRCLTYAMLTLGHDRPQAVPGGLVKRLITHPGDLIPANTGTLCGDKPNGIAETRTFMLTAAPLIKAQLDAACAGKTYSPYPTRWADDFEGGYGVNDFTSYGAGTGWIPPWRDSATASSSLFNGQMTLSQWLANHSTNQASISIPLSPPDATHRNYAVNCDLNFQWWTAHFIGIAYAIQRAVFDPLIAQMGGIGGNWQMAPSSKQYANPAWPTKGEYFFGSGTDFPLGFGNPICYETIDNTTSTEGGGIDPNGSPNVDNWKAAYGVTTQHAAVDAWRLQRALMAQAASGGKPIIPRFNAGSSAFVAMYGSDAAGLASMKTWFTACNAAGIKEFMYFTPGPTLNANVLPFLQSVQSLIGLPT